MKRALLVAVVLAVGVVNLQELADRTRNEDDVRAPGSVSEVVIDVRTRGMDGDLAAAALWAACHPTVSFATVVAPLAVVAGSAAQYAVRVTPALGENDRRRLRGCLEDGTVDRVWGNVVSIAPVSAE
jgi:hypothetical protein